MDVGFSSPVVHVMTDTLNNLLQAANAVNGAGGDPLPRPWAHMGASPAVPPAANSWAEVAAAAPGAAPGAAAPGAPPGAAAPGAAAPGAPPGAAAAPPGAAAPGAAPPGAAPPSAAPGAAPGAAAAAPAEPRTMLETVVGLLAEVMTLSKDNAHWVASPAASGDPDDFGDPAMPPKTRATPRWTFGAAAGPSTPWMAEATPPMRGAATPMRDCVDGFFTPLTSEATSGLTPPLIDTPSSGAFRRFTPPVTAGAFSYFTSPLISENLIDFSTLLVTPAHTGGWNPSDTIPPATESWDESYPYMLSYSGGGDTMTVLLADSLEEWQARMLPEPSAECLLCKYGPIKCGRCCNNDRWAAPDIQSVLVRANDLNYGHDQGFVWQHPDSPRQRRAEVLDWIFKVSSQFFFQRQTAYLAHDFFDRYLMVKGPVENSSLKLIAATALFIAAKKEEVSPPKITVFASATNGACSAWQILRSEVKILKALKWRLSPETPIAWLNSFVQIDVEQSMELCMVPSFHQELYLQITELLDFCSLDVNWLDYSNKELASAAVCHSSGFDLIQRITGLPWSYLQACYRWMIPFKKSLLLNCKRQPRDCLPEASEFSHNIQTYENKLELLRKCWGGRRQPANDAVNVGVSEDLLLDAIGQDLLLLNAIGRDLLDALTNDQ